MEELELEQAIIVGLHLNDRSQSDFDYSMAELAALADACHIKVVDSLTQKAQRINPSHYIGTGKIDELRAMANAHQVETIIFNDELSPSQIRNLEADLDCKIIDRTILILDIFAERAQTREAQLQVEVARLQYMLPRLVGLRASLGRQGGGAGLRNRGAGETKLELDRRRIEERISMLQHELEKLVATRQTQRMKRKKNEVPVVCLVGYTNTGKSSLMNALLRHTDPETTKEVFVKDMLFATLETSVRHIELPDNKSFLLTDTVGFVSQLPHHLVKAFRSTLEEVTEADLLIHVVDFSHEDYNKLIDVTNETLEALGTSGIDMLYVYNKCDLTEHPYPVMQGNSLYMSVREGAGLEELLQCIRQRIFSHYMKCSVLIPYDQGRIVSYFNEHAQVFQTEYEENGTRLEMECSQIDFERYKEHFVDLTLLS
ncbi:GTPase HflX [Paenibacillus montaniterrae]|uniref:GTPase HflX n=1 Tax=Paenibacillus montaniterrae TaxID=429341 RepID=A0A920CZ23_9BACL|nr:GTPase HflX [Paenibacillus montaniterrae]GIP17990.1 GTPase HflX [Paenibacillus montaniterrae]